AVNSPPLLMTRTWSVPSTTTIFISPSATSSIASRSIRLIAVPPLSGSRPPPIRRVAAAGVVARSRRCQTLRAGEPLRLEQLAQPIALGLDRDARDDGLEEAEHDELAGLVGRNAAALEIEQLALVDRPDGARVHRPTAVRLVDLEAGDRHGAGLLRKVHPKLAEEAVGAASALLDRDHALQVGPRRIQEDALREEVAGRVPADVPGVRGQVEQLLVGAEHDLDLLDGASIADEDVVDPAPDEPPAELGEGPVELRGLADR